MESTLKMAVAALAMVGGLFFTTSQTQNGDVEPFVPIAQRWYLDNQNEYLAERKRQQCPYDRQWLQDHPQFVPGYDYDRTCGVGTTPEGQQQILDPLETENGTAVRSQAISKQPARVRFDDPSNHQPHQTQRKQGTDPRNVDLSSDFGPKTSSSSTTTTPPVRRPASNGRGCATTTTRAVKESPPFSDSQFLSRPSYRADVPPRFYPGDLKSELIGAQPPRNVQAVPTNPMDYSRLVCDSSIDDVPEELQNLSPDELNRMIYDKYIDPLSYVDPSEVLPGDDMSSLKYGDKLASDPNTYVYDRLIYANQKRRLNEGADWIRGDLPIYPDNRGWHQVSVKPHLDLRRGAISSHIGPDYSTMIEYGDLCMENNRAEHDVRVRSFS